MMSNWLQFLIRYYAVNSISIYCIQKTKYIPVMITFKILCAVIILRTHRVGPLGMNGFLHLGLFLWKTLYLMGGGLAGAMVVVGRGVLFGANFDFLTVVLKLFGHCFWNCDFSMKFGPFFQNRYPWFDRFCGKIYVFLTLRKLVWSFSEVLWALFLAIKG